jgi:hypothetical protein
MTDPMASTEARWLTPGVRGIGAASFLADVGHEIPTALLPNLLTATLGAPAAAKTLRCRLLALPGRITRSARRFRCTCPAAGPGPATSLRPLAGSEPSRPY